MTIIGDTRKRSLFHQIMQHSESAVVCSFTR